ncbi:MAG: PEP-CTERM sorting domain-containing protein [Phycisphaerales bacterium]
MKTCVASLALTVLAGGALADISTINSLTLNSYENFRNPMSVIPSSLVYTDANGMQSPAPVFNQFSPSPINGGHRLMETIPQGSAGFANRHMLWFSNDGGASAYQLTAGQSFRVSACFIINTNHPTGIGAPVNSETGIWMHNPRTNEAGVNFIDEGGVWAITNGTSFSGGVGQGFFLYGEGGFNNPANPPIIFTGDLIEQTYEYIAPNHPASGGMAQYRATVTNVTRGISRTSPWLGFNAIPGSMENGLNPGTTIGFRFQNVNFPIQDTITTTDVFNVSIIPAPSAAALMGLGLIAAGRRRR